MGLRKEEKVEGTGSRRDRDKKNHRDEMRRDENSQHPRKRRLREGGGVENPVRKRCRALGTAWPTCDLRNVN